jgi:hypothetical protein
MSDESDGSNLLYFPNYTPSANPVGGAIVYRSGTEIRVRLSDGTDHPWPLNLLPPVQELGHRALEMVLKHEWVQLIAEADEGSLWSAERCAECDGIKPESFSPIIHSKEERGHRAGCAIARIVAAAKEIG